MRVQTANFRGRAKGLVIWSVFATPKAELRTLGWRGPKDRAPPGFRV